MKNRSMQEQSMQGQSMQDRSDRSMQDVSTTGKFPTTPDLPSVIVQSADRPWKATRFPGVEFKLLFEDKSSGLFTGLFRWAPGAELPYHEHAALEQTYVLEGGLIDHEGELTAGGYAARPAHSRHVAKASAAGCLNISFFLRPNLFFDENGGAKPFER